LVFLLRSLDEFSSPDFALGAAIALPMNYHPVIRRGAKQACADRAEPGAWLRPPMRNFYGCRAL
jgi:hypothetical protein